VVERRILRDETRGQLDSPHECCCLRPQRAGRVPDGQTALIWAAARGRREVEECLLDRGADIEARDRNGWTALIAAARKGHTEVVECPLDGYPKWAGVAEEVQQLVGLMIANTTADHGECSVLLTGVLNGLVDGVEQYLRRRGQT
jgi:hypothetical protein